MDEEGGGKASQIFCLAWVKKGAAKLTPDQITLSPEELKGVISNDANENGEGEDDADSWEDMDESDDAVIKEKTVMEVKRESSPFKLEGDDLAEYNMDDYDDEEGDFSGVSGLVMFSDNGEDPYITKKRKSDDRESSDSEEEQEEKSSIKIQPDDNLLVCARCGPYSSVLEVYVYNHESGDFYVHHDIPLMDTPLCMQWVGYDPGAKDSSQGNLLAVGNFDSTIDIWDLDILNTLEPVFSINKKKKKSSKNRKSKLFQHDDAILDLAWTENAKDQLASASADTAVALWDLEFGKCTRNFQHYKSKVQTIEWRPKSANHLISGAFDGQVALFDAKTSKSIGDWSLDGEIERIAWNRQNDNFFIAATDDGLVYHVDCRTPKSYLKKWKAHESAIPGLVITSKCSDQGCMLHTASSDGFVKLWDLDQNDAKLVYKKNMKMGMVHCCKTNPDQEFVIACGGQKDSVKLWDVTKTPEIAQYLGMTSVPNTAERDTLDPLGGGGENDTDVVKYIKGEDYIDESKLKSLASQIRGSKKNEKVKSEPFNISGGVAEDSKQPTEVTGKKKRKRKKRRSLSIQ